MIERNNFKNIKIGIGKKVILFSMLYLGCFLLVFSNLAHAQSRKGSFLGIFQEKPALEFSLGKDQGNEAKQVYERKGNDSQGIALEAFGLSLAISQSIVSGKNSKPLDRDYSVNLARKDWGVHLWHQSYSGFSQIHSNSKEKTDRPDITAERSTISFLYSLRSDAYGIDEMNSFFPAKGHNTWAPVLGLTLGHRQIGSLNSPLSESQSSTAPFEMESFEAFSAHFSGGLSGAAYFGSIYVSALASIGSGVVQNNSQNSFDEKQSQLMIFTNTKSMNGDLRIGYNSGFLATGAYLQTRSAEINTDQAVKTISTVMGIYVGGNLN